MRKLAFLILLAVAGLVSSCGSNTILPNPTSTTAGNWEAQLVGGEGPASQLNFIINFGVKDTNGTGTQPIYVNELAFINVSPSSCFPNVSGESPNTASGSVNLTTNLGTNQITGSLTLTVTSKATGSTLTLNTSPSGEVLGTNNNGTMSNGAASGTWTLTSSTSGCSAGGTGNSFQPSFIMCQGTATCSAPIS